jgi:hypothetical protein
VQRESIHLPFSRPWAGPEGGKLLLRSMCLLCGPVRARGKLPLGVGKLMNASSAEVIEVVSDFPDMQELSVRLSGSPSVARAICYPGITGNARPGDKVIVNTTAVDLGLGSGGRHFVIWVSGRDCLSTPLPGHIMKMRYAPMQLATGSYEENPTYREAIEGFSGLSGMPVVICELHSMVAPVVAGFSGKIAYIMTDGAALPYAFSKTARRLKDEGLLHVSITAGHAFGGDLEAVNIHSALVAACAVCGCDGAVVAMGPGIVGTATRYGFSGIEQAYIADAVNRMGGCAIIVPRLSRCDRRERHRVVSHHTITVLSDVCCTPVTCVLASDMDVHFLREATDRLSEALLAGGHRIAHAQGGKAIQGLRECGIELSTMSRGFDEEPEFFLTSAAAGVYARSLLH